MTESIALYGYWRSSAAYRVRIGLNLKGLAYQLQPVHLVREGGDQHGADFVALNPQRLVPVLRHGGQVIRQSMAILEYLDEACAGPQLLPAAAVERARVRALAQLVACDIHPLNNLRVVQYLARELDVDEAARDEWTRHWIRIGFEALEALLASDPLTGRYCHGDAPGLADCCLVPQVYNARRFALAMDRYPTITRIDAACQALPAFQQAHPSQQPDAAPG